MLRRDTMVGSYRRTAMRHRRTSLVVRCGACIPPFRSVLSVCWRSCVYFWEPAVSTYLVVMAERETSPHPRQKLKVTAVARSRAAFFFFARWAEARHRVRFASGTDWWWVTNLPGEYFLLYFVKNNIHRIGEGNKLKTC
ncbi:unnamed protein product [Laminaria digitata]